VFHNAAPGQLTATISHPLPPCCLQASQHLCWEGDLLQDSEFANVQYFMDTTNICASYLRSHYFLSNPLVVVLLETYREMEARRNSAETNIRATLQGMDQRPKMEKVFPKMAHRRDSDAGQSRRRLVRFCR